MTDGTVLTLSPVQWFDLFVMFGFMVLVLFAALGAVSMIYLISFWFDHKDLDHEIRRGLSNQRIRHEEL